MFISSQFLADCGLGGAIVGGDKYDKRMDAFDMSPEELAHVLASKYGKGKSPNRTSLQHKIFLITQAAQVISRNGVAPNNGPDKEARPLYAYVKIEDVLDAILPLLKKHRLILTGNVPKEPITNVTKTYSATEALVEWTLTDVDTKESLTIKVPGAGLDTEGKGVYKSLTGSRKYAMVLLFNLKFGDEPEEVAQKNGQTNSDNVSD